MQRNNVEVAVSGLRVQSLVGVVIKLYVEHIFAGWLAEDWLCSQNILHSHIEGRVSHLADLMNLTFLDHIFKTKVAWRVDQIVLIHPVAFPFDMNVIFLLTFT